MVAYETSWQQHADTASKIALCAALFLLPVTVTGMSIALALTLLFSAVAGQVRAKLHCALSNPVAIAALLYLGFAVISISYSQVSWSAVADGFHKYSKLLAIPLFIPLFTEQKWRERGINAFLLAMTITLLLSYGKLFDWVKMQEALGNGSVFKNHIETSFMVAFVAFIFACRAWNETGFKRYCYVILLLLSTYQVYFISGGRTGYIVFAALTVLFLWQRWRWRGLLVTLLSVPLLVFVIYQHSTVFKQEIISAQQNIQQYKQNKITANSFGLRLTFLTNSLLLIKDHPLRGNGLGSFYTRYNSRFAAMPDFPGGLGDPHNEYLMTTVEMGLIGLALLLFMFFQQWRCSYHLSDQLMAPAQAMLVAFIIGAACDSFLYLSTPGCFFVLFSALFFAGLGTEDRGQKIT